MISTTNRGIWHRADGKWTLSLGTRGARVRLFENKKGGVFYRDVWINGRKDRRSLRTRDRREAERFGKRLLAELLSGKAEEESGVLTLGTLWRRFSHENKNWLDNQERGRKDDERTALVLMSFFGEGRDVVTLSENDVASFRQSRLEGGIAVGDGTVTKAVRQRTVQSDLKFLRAMLRWATTVRVNGNGRLLMANPLDGVRLAGEVNALRPVATWERFKKTRQALRDLRAAAKLDVERRRWLKVDLALVLAEATGRRLNSIRQLRWVDIDLKKAEIRWRADADKKGKEWLVPISQPTVKELKGFRKRLGIISEVVFPSDKDSAQPMDRYVFDWWLRTAEKEAGLPKLKGGLWHPYRRKWATERKDLPVKDVMAAGGWSDADTLLRSYQQADRETPLRVMSEPRKLTEKARTA